MIFAFAYYITSFVLSLVSPFWGLVGFVCSLLLRFQDRYPEVVSIKPFTLLLFGLILGCIINADKLSKIKWAQDKKLSILLAISIFGLLIMAPGQLIGETYVFICSLSLFYFATRILQTPWQFIILFICMALSITHLAIEAIQGVALDPKSPIFIDPRSDRWQGVGYYANSNEFGQLMITTMPFLLALIFIRKSIFLAAGAIILMIPMIYVMAKCESRTVMITLGLMFIGTIMLRGKGNIIKKAITGAGLTFFLVAALSFVPGPIQDRLNTVTDAGNDESFQGRTRAWGYGFDMVMWYPITGVGKGQWGEHHGLAPHNSYVQVMAELGIFGIWVFLSIIWLCIKQFKPIFDPDPPPKNITEESFGIDEHSSSGLFDDNSIDENTGITEQPEVATHKISNLEKTVCIATLMTFAGWLLYIFLGNQAYSVWTYFYIGLCAATANFLPQEKEEESNSIQFDAEEIAQ